MSEVNIATNEQKISSEQLNASVMNIDRESQKNATTAEGIDKLSEELKEKVEYLGRSITKFKLE